ncbi:MAG: prenyltransferase/squalene oxidase repeat-containing protein [Candidatus Firestonebacteria bacterium]
MSVPRQKTMLFLIVLLFFPPYFAAKTQKEAVDSGLKWLRTQQKENGAFMDYPAITALCVSSFLHNGATEEDPAVRKGIEFILKCAKEDGSIAVDNMGCYNTSICVMTLYETKNSKYEKVIEKAREWLKKIQVGNGDRVESDDKYYGGIGYDSHMKPDFSNLQHALEALKVTSGSDHIFMAPVNKNDEEVFERAIFFISRCQNLKGSNDQKWAGTDGGFIYSPDGESKAKESKSYGSMTYAGLKSFIYCNVDRHNPRVIAAINWIRDNYTVNENPNMGTQGLYYYYHTFAKALKVFGEKSIRDEKGAEHVWAKELSDKVVSLQKPEGYWINDTDRWWESKKELATAYSLLTLSYCEE